MNFKMFVLSHKFTEQSFPENYYIMQLNSQRTKIKFGDYFDCKGDNISPKNPNYCELTGIYEIWKNINDIDIIGTCHYRRVFTTNKFSKNPKTFLNKEDVEKYLSNHDIITTKLYKTKITTYEHMLVSVKEQDLKNLDLLIKEKYSDYYEAYKQVMNGHKSYLLNMFVMKRDLFEEYCEFIFPLLQDLEKMTDLTGYTQQEKRLYGYLAERLLTIFVIKKNLRVKSLCVNNLEESVFAKIFNKITSIFKKY